MTVAAQIGALTMTAVIIPVVMKSVSEVACTGRSIVTLNNQSDSNFSPTFPFSEESYSAFSSSYSELMLCHHKYISTPIYNIDRHNFGTT